RLVALTRAVLRSYPVPEDEHVHAVRLLGSTINGYLTLTGAGGFDHRTPAPDASWPRVLAALDVALHHWPTGPEPEETR
uniref:TetR-like C-terminal domain-containing protein n=1 Tax=Desertihabitans aurantiacus TaxID=2282477 RepID=UPI0018E5424C